MTPLTDESEACTRRTTSPSSRSGCEFSVRQGSRGRGSRARLALVAALCLVLAPGHIAAWEGFPTSVSANMRTLGIVVENDMLTGEDSGYTSGVGIIGSLGPFERFDSTNVPEPLLFLIRRTWIARLPDRIRGRTFGLAQIMQTPEDIEATNLQEDDLPYAATLTATMTLYAFDELNADRLALTAGLVGPSALGEQSQKTVHEAIGAIEPMGWDHQLRDEPVFRIEASRSRRVPLTTSPGGTGTDLVGMGSVSIGNLSSALGAGVLVRAGRSLDVSHAVASLVPNRQVNPTVFGPRRTGYVYLGAEMQYVANDILVDGNTFRDSHSVPLDHTRARLAAGASASFGRLGLSLLYARFPGNIDDDAFGAVSVTWRY